MKYSHCIVQMKKQGFGGIVGIHLHIYSFKSPYVTANGLLHFVLLNVCDINLFLVNNKIFAPFWKTSLSAARLFDRFWQLAVSSSWNKLSAVSCLLVQLWTPAWRDNVDIVEHRWTYWRTTWCWLNRSLSDQEPRSLLWRDADGAGKKKII